jgi:Raf kinase inhibitor-like YbhB/YbcL family protein
MRALRRSVCDRGSGRSRQRVWFVAAGILLASAALPGCRGFVAGAQTLTVTSTSFQGSRIPAEFTCSGEGISPQLAWSAPPAGTVSLALVVTDPDAPGRTFVHWVLYDLPAATRALPKGLPGDGQLVGGGRQGRNDFGNIGYGGPCPPGDAAHHYHFTVYALNAKLGLTVGATRAQVEAAMQGHIWARGELVGVFGR